MGVVNSTVDLAVGQMIRFCKAEINALVDLHLNISMVGAISS